MEWNMHLSFRLFWSTAFHIQIRSWVSAVGIELCPGNGQVTWYELLPSGPHSVVCQSGGCTQTLSYCCDQDPLTGASVPSQQQSCFSSSLIISAWYPGVGILLLCCIKWLADPICLLGGTLGSGASQIVPAYPGKDLRVGLGWESQDKTVRP